MQQLSNHHTANALHLLADAAATRENEINDYSTSPIRPDSDKEPDYLSPIYDSFYLDGKSAAINQMTNFDTWKFFGVWSQVHRIVDDNWNVGRGKKSSLKGKDVFSMLVTVMKHGGNWDCMARMFGIKGPTFERLITRFLRTISELVYERCVLDLCDKYPMDVCVERKKTFKHHPMARYATDVTFQQANMPSGNMQEGKKYYSGKHKLYEYKTEVFVFPFGLAINCTNHYPGSIADIDILHRNLTFHDIALEKTEKGKEVTDIGLHIDDYPESWALLLDKGYQGALDWMRAIHPKKKPKNGILSVPDEAENKKKASDRVIVENYFERKCTLWTVCSSKYKWEEDLYDHIFRLCIALKNCHIRSNPLRAADLEFYRRYKNRQYIIGEEVVQKRKKVQEKYRTKRKKRMEVVLNEVTDSDNETLSP